MLSRVLKILFVVTRVVTCDHITYRRIFLGGQGHLSMRGKTLKLSHRKCDNTSTHVNINKFLCFYHKTEIYYTKKKYLH